MAQSWITEVSMEVDAEVPTIPAPPPPPPPPPDPALPPVPAPGVTYPTPAPATAQSPAPVGALAFYQDPYSSFSQYGAVQQQYADPQASQWAGYHGGFNYNNGLPQQYPGYPPAPTYPGYSGFPDPQQQQQYGQQAYAQQWPGYATTAPQTQPPPTQAYAAQPPHPYGQAYLPTQGTPAVAQEAQPSSAEASGTMAPLPPLPPPPPPPLPDAGEQKQTPAPQQHVAQQSTAPQVDSAPRHEVRQREATGRDRRGRSHQASNGTNGRVEAAEPPEKEPEDEGAWPASLRRYLQRAFDKCDKKQGSRQHALLEKALHRKVTDAMANNEMLRKDWDNEPLPSLLPPKRERSPSRAARYTQQEKSKKRSHGQTGGGRGPPTPRKGKGSLSKMPHMDQRRLSNRLERFDLGARPPPSSRSNGDTDLAFQSRPMVDDNGLVDWAAITIKGTSTKLEKDYLRLTQELARQRDLPLVYMSNPTIRPRSQPPDPASVRPQPILEQSLEKISAQWAKGGMDYVHACSQLKAVRQDCVVQRIKNAFTVQVYEAHARIALQEGDLNEYNQCQTQLKELYACGLPGSQEEFTAYRVLYNLYLQTSCSGGSTGLQKILRELQAGEQGPAVSHALRVRKALAITDYHLFFSLYETTPNLGVHIMERLLKTMRVEALRRIFKAFRPTISLSFVLRELLFDTDEIGVAFLQACGVVLTPDGLEIACKESVVDPSGLDAEAPNSLL